ncbi:cytidyltransferase, partial [Candidatus Aerophobetes bacterium]
MDDKTRSKIKELEELAHVVESFRAKGKKVVHCHGVFDLLHIGHIRYFKQAREMGDVLVVTITPDKDVDKGPYRPAFSEDLRAEAIASLSSVDFVAVNKWRTAEETIRLLQPNVYVKGSDFKSVEADETGKLALEANVCREIGAEVAFTTDIVFSSTNLINRFFSSFPDEVREYLRLFEKRYSLDFVIKILEDMANLKILVIGDTILDDYHYCHTLGSSSKDPALAVQYDSRDLFAGGVLAVANHCANFTNSIRLFTVIGELDSHEDFIRSKLDPQIDPFFLIQDDAPTLIKRRFVEGYSMSKLFEVYIMDDSGLSDDKDAKLCDMLRKELPTSELVIVSDFGHGAISRNTIDTL